MFPVCNLLTRAESPAGCLWQAGFAPVFLCRTHVKIDFHFVPGCFVVFGSQLERCENCV
ncbi:hypothetical protein [Leptospira noguchii]|uniref:hypothetical protein n=1 Tax=Leptospira noguchii TaxID=28182 RepID=UPI001FB5BE29|nr:hypothetical protein [Leptospira noguchii]UOG53691.1 hypothetical protein MAL09_06005 [Leptospira noguchii]